MIATKEQERQALEKIRKIIAGLGENSYVGTAFEGCFEIAESNIEYDFAESLKSEVEMKDDAIRSLRVQLDEKTADAERLQKQIETDKGIRDTRDEILIGEIKTAKEEKAAAEKLALDNIREIHLELTSGEKYDGQFTEIKYNDSKGFRFVTVIDLIGWATSYKMDDIKSLCIK